MTTVEQAVSPRKKSEHIRLLAGGYLGCHLGDQLSAGEPTFDEAAGQWIVSIHARSLPKQTVIGQMRLDVSGNVVQAPTGNEVLAALRTQALSTDQPESGMSWLPPDLMLSTRNSTGQGPGTSMLSAEEIAQLVIADPMVQAACSDLIIALASPRFRDSILQTVSNIARTVQTEESK